VQYTAVACSDQQCLYPRIIRKVFAVFDICCSALRMECEAHTARTPALQRVAELSVLLDSPFLE
jgi:hypothetical protein